jgi:hypothetical protein
MRTGVAAAAALAIVGGLGPVSAGAATPRHEVFVYGTRSAYVDVTFPRRFRPHVGAYNDPVRPDGASAGRYTGVWIESLTRRGTGPGNLATTSKGGYWHAAFGEPADGAWLAAGRYRVHLMTEGFSYYRFLVDGLTRTLVLQPRHAETVRTQLVKPSVDGVPGARMSASVRTGSRTLAITVGLVRADESRAELSLCVAASALLPCEADPDARHDGPVGTPLGAPQKVAEAVVVVAMPKTLPDGEHEVAFVAAALPDSTRMELFTLTLG